MKKIFQIFSLLTVCILWGQQISDYQYILVPTKFNDAKANRYDLDQLLSSQLIAKKFTVITPSSPERKNLCEYLTAEISDTGNMLTNKARIDFKDCTDKSIATFDGKSNSKDLKAGMQEALRNAMMKIPVSSPMKTAINTQENSPAGWTESKVEEKTLTPQISSSNSDNTVLKSTQKAEIFSNGTLNLNKIFLSNGEFLLVNPNSSVPFATFKQSSKKDTYRVQLPDGTSTLGYIENGNIVIEIPNSDGTFKTEVFEKK